MTDKHGSYIRTGKPADRQKHRAFKLEDALRQQKEMDNRKQKERP